MEDIFNKLYSDIVVSKSESSFITISLILSTLSLLSEIKISTSLFKAAIYARTPTSGFTALTISLALENLVLITADEIEPENNSFSEKFFMPSCDGITV